MRKLAVIGLGHVGATVAYTLVTKGLVDELVLIDKNEDKVVAEQYDLLDMLARIDKTMLALRMQMSSSPPLVTFVLFLMVVTVLANSTIMLLKLKRLGKKLKKVALTA